MVKVIKFKVNIGVICIETTSYAPVKNIIFYISLILEQIESYSSITVYIDN